MFWFTMAILLGYIGIYDMGVLITRMDATIWFSQIDDWPNLKTIAMLTFQKGICFRLSIASVDYQFVQCSKRSTFRMYCTPKPCNVALSSAWLRPLTPFWASSRAGLLFRRHFGSNLPRLFSVLGELQHATAQQRKKQVFVPPQLCNSPPQSDWPSCRGWMKKLSAVVVLLIFPVTNGKTDWWDILHAARGVQDIQQVPSAQIQHFQRPSLCFCCGTATRRSSAMATPFNAPRGRPIAMFDTGGEWGLNPVVDHRFPTNRYPKGTPAVQAPAEREWITTSTPALNLSPGF